MQGRPGRIVMVSSVGGRFAAPFIGGYAASKHGLEGMSASLRRELILYGIDVIIVGMGYHCSRSCTGNFDLCIC